MSSNDWYNCQKLGDDVSLILEENVFADWRCNIWHIKGRDRDLVIDTGLGLRPLADEVAKISDKPVIALCTHSHYDHSGGLHEFEHRYGHAQEAEIYENPTRFNTVTENFLEPSHVHVEPYPNFDADQWCVTPAKLTCELNEGDVIDLGDRVFEVLHMPGHSPGSIALWEKDTGIMFTGDTLYDGDLFDHLFHSVPEQLRESLRRLQDYPIRVVHAGHDDSFGKDRMAVIIDEYRDGKRSFKCPSSL